MSQANWEPLQQDFAPPCRTRPAPDRLQFRPDMARHCVPIWSRDHVQVDAGRRIGESRLAHSNDRYQ
jgi:hypothetical protein